MATETDRLDDKQYGIEQAAWLVYGTDKQGIFRVKLVDDEFSPTGKSFMCSGLIFDGEEYYENYSVDFWDYDDATELLHVLPEVFPAGWDETETLKIKPEIADKIIARRFLPNLKALAPEGWSEFNKRTGELVLSGEITKELLDPYRPELDMPATNPVKSVRCEPGCILPADCSRMFWAFTECESIDLTFADTSHVTDMHGMFAYCEKLVALNLSFFDTSNVTDMNHIFEDCRSLPSLDLSNFDTSNVTDMNHMFDDCYSLKSLDVSTFETARVKDMCCMFANCESLTSLNTSSFNTSNVEDMYAMFAYCEFLTSLDVSNFDTSNVTRMGHMFEGCDSLKTLDLSTFDTSNVTDTSYMFTYCTSIENLDLTSFDTSKVRDMSCMFLGCSFLSSLNLSSFDTSHVTNMYHMFDDCYSLPSLDLSSFDTSKVKDMSCMFQYCTSITSLDVSTFDTSNVEDMSSMFYECSSLTSLDLSSFDSSHSLDVGSMFAACEALETVKLGAPQDGKQDSLRVELKASVLDCPLARIEFTYPLPENKELVQTIESTRELPDTPRLSQQEKDWILAQEEPVSLRQVCLAKSAGADLSALDAQELSRFADAPQKSAPTRQSERKTAR